MSSRTKRDIDLPGLLDACRENSTACVLFHAAIARRAGLGPTDHKALDEILRHTSLTAGDIATYTGLASASVTSLIDRLEAKGLVRRMRDPTDRRRVIVQPVPERVEELAQLFGSLQAETTRLLARYDESQLETIRDFLLSSTSILRDETTRLAEEDAP